MFLVFGFLGLSVFWLCMLFLGLVFLGFSVFLGLGDLRTFSGAFSESGCSFSECGFFSDME